MLDQQANQQEHREQARSWQSLDADDVLLRTLILEQQSSTAPLPHSNHDVSLDNALTPTLLVVQLPLNIYRSFVFLTSLK